MPTVDLPPSGSKIIHFYEEILLCCYWHVKHVKQTHSGNMFLIRIVMI